MKLNRIPTIAITVIALAWALPMAALADVTGTPTLAANTAWNLETGATASSGGDILWNGSSMTPQGTAKAFNIGGGGAASFSQYTQTLLSQLDSLFSNAAIPGALLAKDDIFAMKTKAGNYAKLLVTGVSGTSISLQFQTFGGSSTPAGPTITQILNNYGLVPAGFSNSGISQGSLFIIKGSGLADPNAQAVLQDPTKGPLQTTLNGASVKITANGVTFTPVFYYAIAGQLALVLPSNTSVGAASLTVTYNGQTSSPAPFQVVQNAMGFGFYNGLALSRNNATGHQYYLYNDPIPPGTTISLWGSGLGADPARDTTYVGAAFTINGLAHLYLGGVEVSILYQGASGYPGLNQLVITVPASSPTGCNVSLVGVSAAGVPTNFTSLAIGNGDCSDPAFGTTGTQLQNLGGQTTVNPGIVELLQSTQPASSGGGTQTSNIAVAIFESVTGSSYGSSSGSVSIGGSVVTQSG